MVFRVGTPSYDSQRKVYELDIEGGSQFSGEAVTPYPIDFTKYNTEFTEFVTEFLNQASPYFSKRLDTAVFMQRVVHSYSTEEDLSGTDIKSVSWIPARVLFYPTRYEIQWRPSNIEKNEASVSGNEILETDVLLSDRPVKSQRMVSESAQKRIRQKIRQARIKCALARLHVERITEKYYAQYGSFDGFSEADSELSSDFEFNPNEVPRKI
jgi:hypothetical protein